MRFFPIPVCCNCCLKLLSSLKGSPFSILSADAFLFNLRKSIHLLDRTTENINTIILDKVTKVLEKIATENYFDVDQAFTRKWVKHSRIINLIQLTEDYVCFYQQTPEDFLAASEVFLQKKREKLATDVGAIEQGLREVASILGSRVVSDIFFSFVLRINNQTKRMHEVEQRR